jgi:multidrug efflux pump subunit AcrA (membrane-fusion protein)
MADTYIELLPPATGSLQPTDVLPFDRVTGTHTTYKASLAQIAAYISGGGSIQALIDAAVATEATIRQNADNAEILARMQAVLAETAARAQADAAEAAARAQADTALSNNKLDKKPDGTNSLVGTNNKINTTYIPDFLLGQMVYGGVFGANGIINASSFAAALNGMKIDTVPVANYPGYYFIAQAEYTLLGVLYETGDWAVCQGSHTPAWVKVDNTDAVSSVAGKRGAVVLVKADVGLGNVDNTPDTQKPVSSPQQAAIAAETAARQSADAAEAQARQKADADHAALTAAHGSTATPAVNRIAMYGASGGLKSGKPPADANDVARKAEIDGITSALSTETAGRKEADHDIVQSIENLINNVISAMEEELALKANRDSDTLTGIPQTPTPDGTVPGQITNVAFVLEKFTYLAEQIDSSLPASFVTLDGYFLKTLSGVQYVMR